MLHYDIDLLSNDLELKLFRVARLIMQIHTELQRYGTDQNIYYAEIHLINVIKNHEGIHLTEIANKLGITKGAVSQNVLRLIKKGLLEKRQDPAKRTRNILIITAKGELAHKNHLKMHKELQELIDNNLKGSTQQEQLFLKNFLNSLHDDLTALRTKPSLSKV